MEIAAATVGSILPKLQAYLLLKHDDGADHDDDDAELLHQELTRIHAALRDAAAARGHAHASPGPEEHRAWAGAARELAYDVDDAIDALLLKPPPARGQDAGGGHDDLPPPSPVPVSLHALLQRATDLSASRPAFAGEAPLPPAAVTRSDLVDDDDDKVELIGADGARDGLISRLRLLRGSEVVVDACDDRKKVKAVAVVGSVGLGKTALARSAYGVLRPQFDCAAFISIGLHPHIESVLRSLLRQLGFTGGHAADAAEEPRDETESKLISQLSGFLQNKRYLIVVDDLWDTQSWDKIRCALADNNHGSRIIATTRNFDVADQVGTPYELKPLSAEDSRTLFFRTVFGHEDNKPCPDDDDDFTKLAEEISKKCSVVPLAIITLAKMLASKMGDNNREEWHKQVRGYIGSGLDNTPDVQKMRTVTSLGYYNLPPHLRACLLYMSVFPEDCEIRRGRLVWRWIAEGLVVQSEDQNVQSLFELGESYVDELVNTSMIQLLDVDYADDGGRDECCYSVSFQVMDLISHLSSQETFVTVLDADDEQLPSPPSGQQIRRVSIRGRRKPEDSASNLASISLPQHLRSVSVFFSSGELAESIVDLSTAGFLRVLDLEGCDLSGSNILQNYQIGSLIHLRYLGLRDTRIAAVPESIGKLRSLQTLDLADTKVDELPASVLQLRELMCLRVDYRTRVPSGIGSLTALEELSDVSTRDAPDVVEELGKLTKLRVLKMTLWKPSRTQEEALLQSLRRLRNLQVLDVYVTGGYGGGGGGDDCSSPRLDMVREAWAPPRCLREFHARAMNSYASPLRALPAWIDAAATPRLAVLVVQVQELRQRDVDALGRLPALRVLRVDPYYASSEEEGRPLVVPGGAFPRLTECRFRDSDLGPVFRRGAAPRLRRLEFCFRVRNTVDLLAGNDDGGGLFDFGLGYLESLEEAVVYVGCQEATEAEAEAAEAALRAAADAQPNRAMVDVVTFGEELMRFDDDD